MKKNIFKLFFSLMTVVVMMVSTFVILTFSVSAEATLDGVEYEPYIVIASVKSMNEEDNSVYLTNDCALTQDEFHRYSGETFDLKLGDVIKVYCSRILMIIPGQFVWSNDNESPKIEYLGTAKDYYDTKELVVAEKNDTGSDVTFKDSEGNLYAWNSIRNPVNDEYWGYKITEPTFDPKLMEIGDIYECAVETSVKYVGEEAREVEVVVVPVSVIEKANVILGDANDDKTVAMSDLVMMQRYLTKTDEFTLNNYANADLNGDGNVDVFDVVILRRKILYG